MLSYLLYVVLLPDRLLPCPNEAIADHLSLLCVYLYNITKSLKEVVADATWVQSTTNKLWNVLIFCSGQHSVHGTVNNNNNTSMY